MLQGADQQRLQRRPVVERLGGQALAAAPASDEVHDPVEASVPGDDVVQPGPGRAHVEQVHDAALDPAVVPHSGDCLVESDLVGVGGRDNGVSREPAHGGATGRAAGTGDRDDAFHAAAVMPRVSAITCLSFLVSASKNMLSGNSSGSTSSTSPRGCLERSSASAPRAHFEAGCGAR